MDVLVAKALRQEEKTVPELVTVTGYNQWYIHSLLQKYRRDGLVKRLGTHAERYSCLWQLVGDGL